MTESAGRSVRRIVAGVDGSPSSVTALRWAIDEAARTGDTVAAVIAWEYLPAVGLDWVPLGVDQDVDPRAIAERTLTEALDKAAGSDRRVAVERRVVEGYASSVLVDASAHADLLVVGSRGHGPFTDALLGSVSQNCAHHAKCPVVIVRDRS
jgi:nucleotide-binding universal stress UspA family protein